MMPFDNKKKQPMVVSSKSSGLDADLVGEASKRCMVRFIQAVQDANADAAIDALQNYLAIQEYAEEMSEDEMES